MTAEDAAALAGALEKALDDIPDNKNMPPRMVVLQAGDEAISPEEWIANFEQSMLDSGVSMLVPNAALHPFEFFGDEMKQKRLIPFIKFCRKGGFSIH